MKKILVTAGGTTIAWHICKIAHEFFADQLEVQICDINASYLIPASIYAYKTHKVPYCSETGYLDAIDRIIETEEIDVIIPLLPEELFIFASDSSYIKNKGIISTAAKWSTSERLADKLNMFVFLKDIGIATPTVYRNVKEIQKDVEYLYKPRLGYGSLDIKKICGHKIIETPEKYFSNGDHIVQEYCNGYDHDEVTVEAFCFGPKLKIFARRRIATKAGVCVKMEPVDDGYFIDRCQKIADNIELPIAFNMQFLYDQNEWKLFDCNLRLAAGTALTTAVGFQLTRALLAVLIGETDLDDYFQIKFGVKSVLRVYQEIVIDQQ